LPRSRTAHPSDFFFQRGGLRVCFHDDFGDGVEIEVRDEILERGFASGLGDELAALVNRNTDAAEDEREADEQE
jgi:hypothetical protein